MSVTCVARLRTDHWSSGHCTNKARVQDPSGWHCGLHSDARKAQIKLQQDQRYQKWTTHYDNQQVIAEGWRELLTEAKEVLRISKAHMDHWPRLDAAIAKIEGSQSSTGSSS